jgi:hypothetical protein
MTATYTANLASLLVEKSNTRYVVEDMYDVVAAQLPVCTYEGTGADSHIKTRYPSVRRVPLPSELETYEALHDGRCGLAVGYYQNWLGYAKNRTYNPDCDLAWVGRTIKTIQSGFAVSADVGDKCSSLVRDVLNIYLDELVSSGYIEELWDREYSKTQDINCDAASTAADISDLAKRQSASRRQLQQNQIETSSSSFMDTGHRQLKAGGRGAAAGAVLTESSDEDQRLTINEMAGSK